MTEYICVTLLADPDEAEPAFKARLMAFWTHMIRNKPTDYERVYAEATRFSVTEGCVSRQYMVEAEAVTALLAELMTAGIAFSPIDEDDTYTKYEATSPDWFQIDH